MTLPRVLSSSSLHRTGNYLAACMVAGAAAESILLALAIAKVGDEAKVLVEYSTTGGRCQIIKRVGANASAPLTTQLESVLQPLGQWNGGAGHATMTAVTKVEAHMRLTDLLRLGAIRARAPGQAHRVRG